MLRPFITLKVYFCFHAFLVGDLFPHDGEHRDRTYQVTPAAIPDATNRRVHLAIREASDGSLIPARFSVTINGELWVPESLSEGGIRFVSIHEKKKQTEVVLFSRGTGKVTFEIPDDVKSLSITAVRGLEYIPETIKVKASELETEANLLLRRMVDLESEGWFTADTHLHYGRHDPENDNDWLQMLDADGLHHGFFMVLDGANIQGRWAEQYAYGAAGEAGNDRQRLISGEEFRCTMQGHINLLGMEKLIEPISIGGFGGKSHPWNSPSTFNVMTQVRANGGVSGPAHGGTMAKVPTTMLDAILGGSDFFEIANTFQFWPDYWYRALNCGRLLPPIAGTDLPNYPQRDSWQPFFGDVRTYVRSHSPEFKNWKMGLKNNQVFVSSGPLLTKFQVGESDPAASLSSRGEVSVQAEIVSSQPVSEVEIIRNGIVVPTGYEQKNPDGYFRLTINQLVPIEESSWVAIRAFGKRKERLFAEAKRSDRAFLHSAAIPVLLDNAPIRIASAIKETVEELHVAKGAYLENGKFPTQESREEMIKLFDSAIQQLSAKK